MSPKVREIFTRAAVLSPGDERERYLAGACGSDAELRLEVQRLLVDAERADSFLGEGGGDYETVGMGAGGEDETVGMEEFEGSYEEQEGDVVGVYTLRQKIGEGGFGVVWMAEQSEPISRMVALKVVKAGMDTKQVLARFEAERQALAMMDHSNIAKVLDAGSTSSGRPYFAMELVRGVPITEFCNDQNFGPRRRLALFKDVCSAVNHAHQKGIIHRDLKPSNVMVTLAADEPVVKVIDFGIAKATHSKLTDKTLFTRFEQFLGTPVYMSPEQAAMSAIDVDTRSDIYSLGVLLYELLAGAPPFDAKSLLSAGYDEMRRIIREDEPAKPSTKATQTQGQTAGGDGKKILVTASTLKGELDWIVMKAIEKDRTRRYETANAFAADIGRYLADEPVQAVAPSAAYKFKKFARRNKATIWVAAAMVVLLLGGIAATSWQAVRATAERDRATAAQTEAEAISYFLTAMIEQALPGTENGGIDVKVVDVLKDAVALLEANEEIPPGRRAILQQTLANTYGALGLVPQAIELQEEAHQYYLATYGLEHPETLLAMTELANSYDGVGRLEEALKMCEELLPLCRKVLGDEDRLTLGVMTNLASAYKAAGRLDESIALLEESIAMKRRVLGSSDQFTLNAMQNLANSYLVTGRQNEAIEMNEEVLALRRKVAGDEDPYTLLAMRNLAIFYSAAGREEEAIEMEEEALALHRKVLGNEHPDTLTLMSNLATSFNNAGRWDEAIKIGEELLVLCRKVFGDERPRTLSTMHTLANSYDEVDRRDEALKMREEVLALRRKVLGDAHPDTLKAMQNLGVSYKGAGRDAERDALREEWVKRKTEFDDGDQDDPLAEVAGMWVDSNEGSIKIEQDGAEVLATGQNDKVTEWWTKGVGELKGRALTMIHYRGEEMTDVQRGTVASDGSRIDWRNGSHWTRESE